MIKKCFCLRVLLEILIALVSVKHDNNFIQITYMLFCMCLHLPNIMWWTSSFVSSDNFIFVKLFDYYIRMSNKNVKIWFSVCLIIDVASEIWHGEEFSVHLKPVCIPLLVCFGVHVRWIPQIPFWVQHLPTSWWPTR